MFDTQPCSFRTRLVDAGLFFNAAIGLIGRLTKLPPQLGHWLFKTPTTELVQKVHSNVHYVPLLILAVNPYYNTHNLVSTLTFKTPV